MIKVNARMGPSVSIFLPLTYFKSVKTVLYTFLFWSNILQFLKNNLYSLELNIVLMHLWTVDCPSNCFFFFFLIWILHSIFTILKINFFSYIYHHRLFIKSWLLHSRNVYNLSIVSRVDLPIIGQCQLPDGSMFLVQWFCFINWPGGLITIN